MSESSPVPAPEAAIDRGGARQVAVGAAVAAVASMLVVLASPRLSASTADNTVFLTFWSALFAGFGVLTGISIETTRAVTAARTALPQGGTPEAGSRLHPRVGLVGVLLGLGFAGLLAVTAPGWGPVLFTGQGTRTALVVALGCTGYAFHSVVTGALAGSGRWPVYARLVGGESAVRLLLVLAAGVTGVSLAGWEAGAALAAFTAVGFLLCSRGARQAIAERADVAAGAYVRRLLAACVSSGSSAVLVIGFPTLLSATTDAAVYGLAAPLLLGLTLTRAPLMIPLNAFQGVAVSHFVRHRDRGPAALWPIARIVLPIGLLGAAAAWWLGPTLLRWIGGPDYRLSGTTLGLLTLAATGLAMLTLTGAVCQALARHGMFVTGWLAAVAVAVAVLLLPLGLEARTVTALLAGPMVGIVVHLIALRPQSAVATEETS